MEMLIGTVYHIKRSKTSIEKTRVNSRCPMSAGHVRSEMDASMRLEKYGDIHDGLLTDGLGQIDSPSLIKLDATFCIKVEGIEYRVPQLDSVRGSSIFMRRYKASKQL